MRLGHNLWTLKSPVAMSYFLQYNLVIHLGQFFQANNIGNCFFGSLQQSEPCTRWPKNGPEVKCVSLAEFLSQRNQIWIQWNWHHSTSRVQISPYLASVVAEYLQLKQMTAYFHPNLRLNLLGAWFFCRKFHAFHLNYILSSGTLRSIQRCFLRKCFHWRADNLSSRRLGSTRAAMRWSILNLHHQ